LNEVGELTISNKKMMGEHDEENRMQESPGEVNIGKTKSNLINRFDAESKSNNNA